jgi:hypothetical protein
VIPVYFAGNFLTPKDKQNKILELNNKKNNEKYYFETEMIDKNTVIIAEERIQDSFGYYLQKEYPKNKVVDISWGN